MGLRRRLILDDAPAGSIAGRLCDGAGPPLNFAGWIGLPRALEVALRMEGDDQARTVATSTTDLLMKFEERNAENDLI